MLKYFNGFILLLFPLILLGQSKDIDCAGIKKGTFYFYPSASRAEFIIVRGDSTQKEINAKTSDTTFWKVGWQSDCAFYLKFIRKSSSISEREKYFYNSHITVIEIISVASDYYTFKAGLDSMPTLNSLTDTLWFNAKQRRMSGTRRTNH